MDPSEEAYLRAMNRHAKAERKRQTGRTILIGCLICPIIALLVVLAAGFAGYSPP